MTAGAGSPSGCGSPPFAHHLTRPRKPSAMKIALIIENSQAAKNAIIHDALTAVAVPLGH